MSSMAALQRALTPYNKSPLTTKESCNFCNSNTKREQRADDVKTNEKERLRRGKQAWVTPEIFVIYLF